MRTTTTASIGLEAGPIASLQGLDTDARVIYVGTFSKVMFPALRLGYVVVPQDLVPAFASARDAADIFSSTLYQAVMTDFIREGHFARHIRRMRMLYMERRRALVNAIQIQMGDMLEVIGAEAGMHLVALLPPRIDDVAVSRRAAQKGISAMPLSTCYLKPPARRGLILGYGGANCTPDSRWHTQTQDERKSHITQTRLRRSNQLSSLSNRQDSRGAKCLTNLSGR